MEKEKSNKILGKIASVFMTGVLIIAAIFLIIMLVSKFTGGDPELFGYKIYYVLTDSMDPTICKGDTILDKSFTPGDELEVDDIVTFKSSIQNVAVTITHRIIEIEGEPGSRVMVTRGDANSVEDAEKLEEKDIVGKYVTNVTFLSKIIAFTRSGVGMAVCWGMILLFAIYIVINYIMYMKAEEKKIKAELLAKKEGEAAEPEADKDDDGDGGNGSTEE